MKSNDGTKFYLVFTLKQNFAHTHLMVCIQWANFESKINKNHSTMLNEADSIMVTSHWIVEKQIKTSRVHLKKFQ
jgi:hypothetical protein